MHSSFLGFLNVPIKIIIIIDIAMKERDFLGYSASFPVLRGEGLGPVVCNQAVRFA